MEFDKEKIRLVPLSSYNIPIIAKMEKKYFSQPWTENVLRDELGSTNSYFMVAMYETEVIGYVGMYCVCQEGYITNLAVEERYRERGVGKFLLQSCLEFAEKKQFEFVYLEVRASNSTAIKLYVSQGFKRVGMRKNFYKEPEEDAIIFTKYYSGR